MARYCHVVKPEVNMPGHFKLLAGKAAWNGEERIQSFALGRSNSGGAPWFVPVNACRKSTGVMHVKQKATQKDQNPRHLTVLRRTSPVRGSHTLSRKPPAQPENLSWRRKKSRQAKSGITKAVLLHRCRARIQLRSGMTSGVL